MVVVKYEALLYLTHPPPHNTTDTNQEELNEHTTFAFVSTHCPLITLESICSTLSSSLFTLTSNGLLLIPLSILEDLLYSYTFKPSCLLLVNVVNPCAQLVPVAKPVWKREIHDSVDFILKWLDFAQQCDRTFTYHSCYSSSSTWCTGFTNNTRNAITELLNTSLSCQILLIWIKKGDSCGCVFSPW